MFYVDAVDHYGVLVDGGKMFSGPVICDAGTLIVRAPLCHLLEGESFREISMSLAPELTTESRLKSYADVKKDVDQWYLAERIRQSRRTDGCRLYWDENWLDVELKELSDFGTQATKSDEKDLGPLVSEAILEGEQFFRKKKK